MEENGITPRNLNISRSALLALIQRYTLEAGLRQLEREIASICRKVARRLGEGDLNVVRVSANNLHEFLGAPKIIPEEVLKKDQIGVATGLAWTAVGGDVLFVEALRMKGKGSLVLTGQLGDVMRESAQAAYSYAKSRAKELEIDEEDFNTTTSTSTSRKERFLRMVLRQGSPSGSPWFRSSRKGSCARTLP